MLFKFLLSTLKTPPISPLIPQGDLKNPFTALRLKVPIILRDGGRSPRISLVVLRLLLVPLRPPREHLAGDTSICRELTLNNLGGEEKSLNTDKLISPRL